MHETRRRRARCREAAAQVVEHDDLVAALDQRVGDVRSDEAGAAGDEHPAIRSVLEPEHDHHDDQLQEDAATRSSMAIFGYSPAILPV